MRNKTDVRPARRHRGFWNLRQVEYCPICGYQRLAGVTRMFGPRPELPMNREEETPIKYHCNY